MASKCQFQEKTHSKGKLINSLLTLFLYKLLTEFRTGYMFYTKFVRKMVIRRLQGNLKQLLHASINYV